MRKNLNQPIQGKKVVDLASIIRTETVLSKLPFHNLSKRETLEIAIAQTAGGGESEPTITTPGGRKLAQRLAKFDLYWEVSPNKKYGEPRQLAYNFDTLVLNKRIGEAGRPISPWLNIGTLTGITRELGLKADTNALKLAILQNASAFVTFKIKYVDRDGVTQVLSDHNNRYGVRFRGQSLPDGSTAEAVYINFSDWYLQILNSVKTRPQDYRYLESLKPAARRFYELTSFLFYAVFKNGQPHAEWRYSEYCKLAPQKRAVDRHKCQTQMGKLHRPHIASGYLEKVQYVPTTDAEGHRDWIIRYWPGPAAKEEYETFTGLRLRTTKQPAKVLDHPARPKPLPEGRRTRNSAPSGHGSPAHQLALRWFENRHGIDDKDPTSAHLQKAQAILSAAGDFETAADALDEAAALGRKNARESEDRRGYPDDLGGVLNGTFVDEAKRRQERREQDAERADQRASEEAKAEVERKAYNAWVDQQIDQLKATGEYDELLEVQLKKAVEFQRKSNTTWGEDMVQQSARSWTRKDLQNTRFSRAHWRRETQGDDA